MDFFEFVFSLCVVLPLVIFKSIMDVKRQQIEADRMQVTEGQGLTMGELKRALREAVEEANEPLIERIESLEQRALPADEAPSKSVGSPVREG